MVPKVGYHYTLTGTTLAPDVQHLKQEFLKNTSCKALFSFGSMVDGGVVLCAVDIPVSLSFVPVCSKLLFVLSAAKSIESQVAVVGPAWDKCRVSHIPTAVELSDCTDEGGCFHPISCRVFLSGTISFVAKNSAVISASAADDTTYFMIYAMVRSVPVHLGMSSFSNRNMCAPALLLDLDSLLKPVSEWAASTMLLVLYVIQSSG